MHGKNSHADMMMKAVGSVTLQQHSKFMNSRCTAARAEKASVLLDSITLSFKTSRVWRGAGIRVHLYREDDSAAYVEPGGCTGFGTNGHAREGPGRRTVSLHSSPLFV